MQADVQTVNTRSDILRSKTLVAALCLMIAFSCATVAVADSSEVSGKVVVDQEVGDAWGIGTELNEEDILDYINQYIEEKTGSKLGYATIEDAVNDLLGMYGIDCDFTKIVCGIDAWAIAEVTEKTSDGYMVSSDGVACIDISLTGSFVADNLGTVKFDGLDLSLYMTYTAVIETTSTFAIKEADVDFTLAASVDGKTNITIVDGETVLVDDLREVDERVAIEGNVLIQPYSPIEIVSADGSDIDQTVKVRYTVEMALVSTFDVDGAKSHQGVKYDVQTVEWQVEATDMGDYMLMVPVIDTSSSTSDMSYTYPFEADPDIPAEILVGDSLKLTDAEKKAVWDGINEIRSENKKDYFDGTHTVTFLKKDGSVLKKIEVADGKTAEFPTDYYSDKQFSGWLTEDDNLWKENYSVRTDLILTPVFAQEVAGSTPAESDFSESGMAAWIMTDGDERLTTVIDNSLFVDGNILFVNVFDEDGVLAYQWCLSSGSEVSDGKIVPLVKAADIPDEQYVKDVADGKKTVYLDFSADGDMPADTSFKYYVGDVFSDGENVTVYHVDESAGTADFSSRAVVKNGYVVMPLPECSSYLLVQDAGSEKSSSNSMALIAVAIVVIVIVVAAALYMRSKKAKSA